jgi:hypothetical protein
LEEVISRRIHLIVRLDMQLLLVLTVKVMNGLSLEARLEFPTALASPTCG